MFGGVVRYIINDDDLEEWIKKLQEINTVIDNETIQYIIEEMQEEINYQNNKAFNWAHMTNK